MKKLSFRLSITMLFVLFFAAGFRAIAQLPVDKLRVKPVLVTKQDTVVQFMPSTIGPWCPVKLLGGDREFGGHGPEIWAWIKLKIVNKKYIDADVYLHARETVSDWSETEGTWTIRIYSTPAGYEISNIESGTYSEVHYVSRPGLNAFSPAGLTLLSKMMA
jgi:hypothetical protein